MSDSLASVSGSIESGGIVLAQRIMSTTHAHVVMMSCARCPGHHHKKVCVLRQHNEVEYNYSAIFIEDSGLVARAGGTAGGWEEYKPCGCELK